MQAQQQPQTTDAGHQSAQATTAPNQPTADYLQQAAGSAIFIYDGTSKPCDPPSAGTGLLPIGSGFVVGLENKSLAPPKPAKWIGLKLLITAQHVVHSRTSITVRLNRISASRFACFTIPLVQGGKDQNVFTSKDEEAADVAAVVLPPMPDTDPTIFAPSMLLDRGTIDKYQIGVGTNVFSVGYFYGYAGEKINYPITKFGKISILTPERWFFNPDLDRYEDGYVVELQNVPGMSGAPVMTYGFEFEANPFQFRDLPPYVIGIVKALEKAPVPVGKQYEYISQGVAVIEPAAHIRNLLTLVVDFVRKQGADLEMNW